GKARPSSSTDKIAARLGSAKSAATGAVFASIRMGFSLTRCDRNMIALRLQYIATFSLPRKFARESGSSPSLTRYCSLISQAFKPEKGKSDVIGATQTYLGKKITERLGAAPAKDVTLHPSTSVDFEVREIVSIEKKMPDVDLVNRHPALQSMCSKD